jgi:DNA primase
LYQRGLTDAVIEAAGLGYNPRSKHEHWSFALEKDVWLPEGIIIPWLYQDMYWRVNIRQRSGCDPKYIQPAGCANGLYRAEAITSGCTIVMVEGEFDALVMLAQTPAEFLQAYHIVPVATGSATGAHAARWSALVSQASRVLLAFDQDEAGRDAARWWYKAMGAKALRLPPTQHDVTDMVVAGVDLAHWLRPFVA